MPGVFFSSELGLRRVGDRPLRALLAQRDGTLYACRHYRIYCSKDDGESWQSVTEVPHTWGRRVAGASRLASRLLRHELKAMAVLSDGTHVASNRQWVFYAAPGESVMRPSKVEEGEQRLAPPMTMTADPGGRILWGEYDSRTRHGRPVRLYVSEDGGRSYQVARVFEGGCILHVHQVVYDAVLGHYWVLAGDHDDEPGIARLSLDLKDFEWAAKGAQQFRAVDVFDFGDYLIYGTDTEKEANAVVRFEKSSGRTERLQTLDGSCIYACRFGGLYALSTTVEPSSVNRGRYASLWLSHDGEHWKAVFRARKDVWHPVYFQYGSIVLPRGESNRETIFFTGQALRGYDGRAVVARLDESGRSGPSDSRF